MRNDVKGGVVAWGLYSNTDLEAVATVTVVEGFVAELGEDAVDRNLFDHGSRPLKMIDGDMGIIFGGRDVQGCILRFYKVLSMRGGRP